jgi:hypothetical protein
MDGELLDDLSPLLQIELQAMLADYASVSEGKLTLVGAGWHHAIAPGNFAIGAIIQVPWAMRGQVFDLVAELLDSDGQPVVLPGNDGSLSIHSQLATTPGPAIAPGSMLPLAFAVNVPPLPLASGRYVWHFTVAGRSEVRWRLPFSVGPLESVQPPMERPR